MICAKYAIETSREHETRWLVEDLGRRLGVNSLGRRHRNGTGKFRAATAPLENSPSHNRHSGSRERGDSLHYVEQYYPFKTIDWVRVLRSYPQIDPR
jgi:hypothetical protein